MVTGKININKAIRRRRDRQSGKGSGLFEKVFENSPQAMVVLRPSSAGEWEDARIVAANRAYRQMTGLEPEQLADCSYTQARPLEAEQLKHRFRMLDPGESTAMVAWIGQQAGRPMMARIFDVSGGWGEVCVCFGQDSHPELKDDQVSLLTEMERTYRYKVTHDSLTDLLNREGMRAGMERCFEGAAGRLMAAMFIDLDNFKMVNDMYGHEAGDDYIRKVGLLLRRTCPERCLVSRLSGDEFLVLDPEPADRESCRALARKILRGISSLHQNEFIEIKASVGLSYYPDHAQDRSTLMSKADIAMYKAKTDGGDRFVEYADTMKLDMLDEYQLKKDLKAALSEMQLTACYQPVVDAQTGRVMSFETLVRWDHPIRGRLFPDQFIPVAQRAGLLPLVDLYMVEKALDFARDVNQGRADRIPVAVNVAANELSNDDFITEVIRIVRARGTDPQLLRLEIKEADAARDLDALADRIDRLSEAGIGVALDDFGRYHSALSLVGSRKFDIIKMNNEFTKSAGTPLRRQLLRMLLGLSGENGFTVVLEGVETPEEDRAVLDLGGRYLQGHFIARPIPEGDVRQWLDKYERDGRRE